MTPTNSMYSYWEILIIYKGTYRITPWGCHWEDTNWEMDCSQTRIEEKHKDRIIIELQANINENRDHKASSTAAGKTGKEAQRKKQIKKAKST